MKFIRYKLINGCIPDYIIDGGYFAFDDYLFGFCNDNFDNDALGLPSYSISDIKDLLISINFGFYDMISNSYIAYTNSEIDDFLIIWVDERNHDQEVKGSNERFVI